MSLPSCECEIDLNTGAVTVCSSCRAEQLEELGWREGKPVDGWRTYERIEVSPSDATKRNMQRARRKIT